MKSTTLAAISASIISATQSLAGSAAAPASAEAEDWEWRVSMPLWAGVPSSGDASTDGVDAPVDMSVADALSLIDMAAALNIEARLGQWAFLADGMYLRLSDNVEPSGKLIESGQLEIEQTIANAALGFRFVDEETWMLDALIGARYNHVGLKFDVDFAPEVLGDPHVDGSKGWVDPIIGLQLRGKACQSATFVAKGDIGGFGVGSDITWQLYGGLEFQLTRNMWGGIGWRHLLTDYQNGDFKYNVSTTGPVLELGINF
jgi:opacity protein-like surface antigen